MSASASTASSTVPSLSSAPSSSPAHLRAIITLVTNDEFVIGARVLAHSLHRVGTTSPLYILITPNLSLESRQQLSRAGYHLIVVQPLRHANTNNHVSSWVDVGYTKLRIWEMIQFEKLLYIDADTIVEKNVDHLLTDPNLNHITFAAAPDTFPPDHFNAGVMLLQPNTRIFSSIIRAMTHTPSYDGGDTGFLNVVFKEWWAAKNSIQGENGIVVDVPTSATVAPTVASAASSIIPASLSCSAYRQGFARLSFGYNALRTMQWFTKKAPKYWEAIQPLFIIHYCSSPKPWEDMEQRRGGFLEQLWFERHEEMMKEEEKQASSVSDADAGLPIQFTTTSLGTLEPTRQCLRAVAQGQMSTFQSFQTLVAKNLQRMPFGEMRYEESGHEEEEVEQQEQTTSAAVSSSPFSSSSTTVIGCVRPLVHRGVWIDSAREDTFLSMTRSILQGCLLDSSDFSTSSSLTPTSPVSPCRRAHHDGIPRRIHQIWLGGALPEKYSEWAASWTKHHPVESGWEYRLWTDADLSSFPLCEKLTDASSAFLAGHLRSLLPRCTSHAQRSDLLRLDILWTLGGLYIDTDFECVASLSPFHHSGAWSRHVDFYTGCSNVGCVELNNGLIASVPQHALIGKLIQTIELPILPRPSESNDDAATPTPAAVYSPMQIITSTGPGHFTRTCVQYVEEWIENHNPKLTPPATASSSTSSSSTPACLPPLLFFPSQVCYPLPNSMRQLTYSGDKQHFMTPATFAVHHWSCSWQESATVVKKQTGAASSSSSAAASKRAEMQQLASLAQSIQQINLSGATTSAASSSSSSSSTTVASPPSTSAAFNPLLLGKIAAFMK